MSMKTAVEAGTAVGMLQNVAGMAKAALDINSDNLDLLRKTMQEIAKYAGDFDGRFAANIAQLESHGIKVTDD